MGRPIRYLPSEGSGLVEVTCRTVQGRYLLTPSPELNEILLGALGRAQQLYRVGICAFAFASNHFHLLLRVESTRQLALFMGHFNSNLAREAGRLVRWREKFWGRRYQSIPVSDEEAAQVERLRYVLAQDYASYCTSLRFDSSTTADTSVRSICCLPTVKPVLTVVSGDPGVSAI